MANNKIPKGYAQPKGFGSPIDITSYHWGNTYSTPSDGLIKSRCYYGNQCYVQVAVDGETVVMLVTPSTTNATENPVSVIPVFKGQNVGCEVNNSNSKVYFIPYTY